MAIVIWIIWKLAICRLPEVQAWLKAQEKEIKLGLQEAEINQKEQEVAITGYMANRVDRMVEQTEEIDLDKLKENQRKINQFLKEEEK